MIKILVDLHVEMLALLTIVKLIFRFIHTNSVEWHFQIIQYVCKIVNEVSNMSVFDQINKISNYRFLKINLSS
jgi:hypothetical protein